MEVFDDSRYTSRRWEPTRPLKWTSPHKRFAVGNAQLLGQTSGHVKSLRVFPDCQSMPVKHEAGEHTCSPEYVEVLEGRYIHNAEYCYFP